MFYSTQLLSRKTALGICWLASHLEGKRLKRTQVFEVSITQSCDSILNPEAPLALRLSGQLLLGVVRIYQRKLQYLETDAKNAIDGLQRSDGSSHNVDLPDGGTAPEMAITLPDNDAGMGLFGTELFPTFAVHDMDGAPTTGMLQGTLGRGAESLTLADDISDVFGSRWTASEQRFDVAGDELDRRFSAELERLRSQAAVAAPGAPGQLFYEGPDDSGYDGAPSYDDGGAGMVMDAPPADMFAMADLPVPGRTPTSVGGAQVAAPGGLGLTPPSEGYSDLLPDLGAAAAAGPSSGGRHGRGEASPGAAGQQQQQRRRRRKKKAQLDVGPDGKPATLLSNDDIRQLLANRAPLLKRRGVNAEDLEEMDAPPKMFDIRAQSEAARESFLYRPASFDRLAPELLAVFNRAFGAGEGGALPSHARRAPRRAVAEPAQLLAADEGGGFGGAPSPPLSAGPARSADDYGDDGGMMDMGPADDDDAYDAVIEDVIEGTQFQVNAFPGSEGPPPGSARIGALPLYPGAAAASGEGLLEEQGPAGSPAGGGNDGSGAAGLARDGFTQRTRLVLEHLQHKLAPPPGSKRRHPTSASADGGGSVTLDSLVAGRSRLEACRWFFEALVLKNKRFIDLQQDEPYGEITIRPLERMTSAAAGGALGSSGGGAVAMARS